MSMQVKVRMMCVKTVWYYFNLALMRKHHRIILNYYLKYMSGFDAQMLRNVVMVSVSGRLLIYHN